MEEGAKEGSGAVPRLETSARPLAVLVFCTGNTTQPCSELLLFSYLHHVTLALTPTPELPLLIFIFYFAFREIQLNFFQSNSDGLNVVKLQSEITEWFSDDEVIQLRILIHFFSSV